MDLGPDIGPFPAGVWGGLVAAGAGLGLLARRRGWFAGSNVTLAEPTDDGTGNTLTGATRVNPAGYIALPNNATTTTVTPDAITDNQAWATAVIQFLITRGVTPTVADAAVRKYLAGMELGVAEVAAVNMALASSYGPPPEGAPPITTNAATPSTTPVTSSATITTRTSYLPGRVQMAKSGVGETPTEIATRLRRNGIYAYYQGKERQPITVAYLMWINGWGNTPNKPRSIGENFIY
jgi:hypothetical protein